MTGRCECGCGRPTTLWRGQFRRYVVGHATRLSSVDYVVDEATGCWEWQLALRNGYGRLFVDGKVCEAHRVYYERHVGPIPPGLQIDHLCRNRCCVNPEHLEVVTSAENTRRGVNTKLTMEDARAIRASDAPHVDLARKHGVAPIVVRTIRKGEAWREPVDAGLAVNGVTTLQRISEQAGDAVAKAREDQPERSKA